MNYDRESVRKLLSVQYALHEVAHHAAMPITEGANPVVTPLAHTLADIYKCLHQGIFGVGHSIQSPIEFKRRLANEMRRNEAAGAEPIIENVSPDGSIGRVNLRPLRAVFDGDLDRACELLVEVCLESAMVATGSLGAFLAALEVFLVCNDAGDLQVDGRAFAFPASMVKQFLVEVSDFVASSGYIPVLSHSQQYRRLNHPAYRVVHMRALRRSPLGFLLQCH